MDIDKYIQASQEALDELKKLLEEKKAIDNNITKVTNLFHANIAMLPDEARKVIVAGYDMLKPPSGLTEAVMAVLTFEGMAAVEVREAVIKSGYDLSGQVNALASISTTLKRLENDGKIISKESGGRAVYMKKFPPRTRFPQK